MLSKRYELYLVDRRTGNMCPQGLSWKEYVIIYNSFIWINHAISTHLPNTKVNINLSKNNKIYTQQKKKRTT